MNIKPKFVATLRPWKIALAEFLFLPNPFVKAANCYARPSHKGCSQLH